MGQFPTDDDRDAPKPPVEGHHETQPEDEPVEPEGEVKEIEPVPSPYQEENEARQAEGEAPDGPGMDKEAHPRLVVKRSGKLTDEEFGFSCPATIGRFDPSVGPIDIDLGNIEEGAYVSRKHAEILCEDGVFKIRDLGSSNGTFILREGNFDKVDEAELEEGTEIALGNARFVFRVGQKAPDESAPEESF
ncbi:MAG: FHA domain-containing protein [Fimbriimonadaceae bacterium]